MISNHLTQLSYFFPWSLVIALLLALIFAIIGVVIFRHAMKKAEEKPEPSKPHPFLERCKLYFARFGLFSDDPLSLSFNYAVKLMHDFIGGKRFRYQLPWVLMLGASSSGKSSIAQGLELDRPLGRPSFEIEGEEKPLCDWWFFDHGILLDLNGKIVLDQSQVSSKEDMWSLFLNLLAQHRPKRPLDGVVLTIPATELVGKTALSHDDVMLRAEYLYEKLWKLQQMTGLRLPIYLTVTKCDQVPGFESFCKSIPRDNKRDIFGWSNDESLDSIYTPEWVNTAFTNLNSYLYRLQEEIYADGETIDGRDGVFLFPIALNQLKGGIRTYTDHLFKPSSYHESFFLRGIYFVGDSHLEIDSPEPSRTFFNAADVDTIRHASKSIFFIDSLFDRKIFREVGVARPVSKALLGNTTFIRFAKVAVAVAAIAGTIGLLRANDLMQRAKINLVPSLNQIEVTLEKTRNMDEASDIGRIFFDDQAQALLNTMTQISVNRLYSIFIPASWFTPLDNKIRYVMEVAYDQVILKSMARQIAYKAEQLVALENIIPVTETVGHGIDPLETLEFYKLRNYVVSIRALELAAAKYNELGMTSSLQDIADIIKYLFNYEVPTSFYHNTQYYVGALKQSSVKIFDVDSYKDNASIKLRKLFDEFQLASFDPNQMVPGLGRLMSSLYEFSGARNYTAYDADTLREVYTSLQETITSITDPGFQWLDADHFDPGPQYEYVMGLIAGSNFFTSSTPTDLLREVDTNFKNFRKRLAGYNSPLIKGNYLFASEEGLAISNPSEGALSLQKNLSEFFQQPFMAQAEDKTILTAVPIGSVLLWDTLRLQEAITLVSKYNDFLNSRILNLPRSLQPLLQKIARENLTSLLVQYISEAEVFSATTSTGSLSSPEDALLSQVQNYRASAPYLKQLLFALRANNANSAFSSLKDLLTSQIYRPIVKLDNILNDEAPYAIKDNSFSWWDGKDLAALEAFGATNLTELKSHLDLQRDRINYLAREFAEPLVSLLEEINQEGMPGNLPLVTKWAGIVSELSGYEKKAPGNGLVQLEDYIMNPLNDVTLATCKKYTQSITPLTSGQEFFETILANIQLKLYRQCVDLSGYVSVDNYTVLSNFFNANLSGRFPFVEKADGSSPDASPEDIRTFFELLDTQAKGIVATLKEAKSLGAAGKNALTFIEQMQNIRTFFGDFLASDSVLPVPSFTLDIDFRVNQAREARANEILGWDFVTQDTAITLRSTSKKGYWSYSDPVKMTFKWALNSPLQPAIAEGIQNYSAQNEQATFSYNGPWALLRLLRQHHAKPSDFPSLNDEQPITLRFDIPLTNVISNDGKNCEDCPRKATAFVRIQVAPVEVAKNKKPDTSNTQQKPGETPKIKMGKPVNLPYFPYRAPLLSQPQG